HALTGPRRCQDLALWALPATVVVASIIGNRTLMCPIHGDLEPSFVLARQLTPHDPATWIERYRHAAYALLLRAGLVGDRRSRPYVRVLALLSTMIGVFSTVTLARLSVGEGWRWLVLPLLLSLPTFAQFALLEAPDVPAWGFGLVATSALAFGVRHR